MIAKPLDWSVPCPQIFHEDHKRKVPHTKYEDGKYKRNPNIIFGTIDTIYKIYEVIHRPLICFLLTCVLVSFHFYKRKEESLP